jgi:hypothetical protein
MLHRTRCSVDFKWEVTDSATSRVCTTNTATYKEVINYDSMDLRSVMSRFWEESTSNTTAVEGDDTGRTLTYECYKMHSLYMIPFRQTGLVSEYLVKCENSVA